jgi:hypothetical protein
LVQTAPARAIFGDETRHTGLARCVAYRWFTDPRSREVYPVEDHPEVARTFVAGARAVLAKHGRRSRAGELTDALLHESSEFSDLWRDHEVRGGSGREKRLQHPEVGVVAVQCQQLLDPEQSQSLLVFTATPGTDDHDKLQLFSMMGERTMVPPG